MIIRSISLVALYFLTSLTSSFATETLTLQQAQKGIQLAQTMAKEKNIELSCAVVDARGDLVAIARMDGARFFTTSIAEGKALASAVLRRPSGKAEKMASSPFFSKLNASFQNRILAMQGAVPILKGDLVIGGIGCSGASPQLDEDAATAGLAAFK